MHPSALLILTSHVSSLCKGDAVARILCDIKKLVTSKVYVHLQNTHHLTSQNDVANAKGKLQSVRNSQISSPRNFNPHTFSPDVMPFVTKFYSEAAVQCSHIDVNVLLHNIGMKPDGYRHILKHPVHCILVDHPQKDDAFDVIRKFVYSSYSFPCNSAQSPEGLSVDSEKSLPVYSVSSPEEHPLLTDSQEPVAKRDSIVLGGTFDLLHAGHKVLLSEAILLARRKIVIGVSDGPLLERKTLKELIQPFPLRKEILESFIWTVARSGLELNIESIEDPYGPSIRDPDLQVILVSKETEKGGHMVNEKRLERGLSKLDVHIISEGKLIEDVDSNTTSLPFQENKISSSSLRFNLLGTLLKPCDLPVDNIPCDTKYCPYVIGLTGGIASGKSSIAGMVEKLGATIIDCDKLGHRSYMPGSQAYRKIVEHFGSDVLSGTDDTIDRRKLGGKVFSDKSQLEALNSIVWPEIERLCKEEIRKRMKEMNQNLESKMINGHAVFVLDAAVLLEAGWNRFADEVWVASIPAPEAVKRIVERNKLSEEEAKKRINSQPSNEWRVERANVVLSTLWPRVKTQDLVEKAWNLLRQRLEIKEVDVQQMKRRCPKL